MKGLEKDFGRLKPTKEERFRQRKEIELQILNEAFLMGKIDQNAYQARLARILNPRNIKTKIKRG